MENKIKFKNNPVTLVGRTLKEGMNAPEFKAISTDLQEIKLSDFKDKIKVITSFPSLDTRVCDLQVKEFNKNIFQLSKDIIIIGISKDLPFAQSRYCLINSINNLKILSDYNFSSFGINYGLLIKELNLLARAALIIDKNNVIRYIQIVDETANNINFNKVIDNLKNVLMNPMFIPDKNSILNCIKDDKKLAPLSTEELNNFQKKISDWELIENNRIKKELKFKDFKEAKYFLDLLSVIAEEQGHHPDMFLSYNKLTIILTTHKYNGLTENDFIMAKIIDNIIL